MHRKNVYLALGRCGKQNKEILTLICNHFHNILRLFDFLPNFPFTTIGTMHNYYLKTWNIRVSSLASKRLKT